MSGLREALEKLAAELEYDVAGAPGKIRALLAAHPAEQEPCRTTPDGWCATHSTADGPVYHDADSR